MAKGNKATTINRSHVRLSGVFTVLIKAGEFHNEHPLKGIGKLKIRVGVKRQNYEEMILFMDALHSMIPKMVK